MKLVYLEIGLSCNILNHQKAFGYTGAPKDTNKSKHSNYYKKNLGFAKWVGIHDKK